MKLKIIGIIIASVFSLQSVACEKPVKYLSKGDTTPCTGYLFSPEKEFEVRVKVEERDQLIKIVDTQKKLITNLNEQTEIYEKKQNMTDLQKFVYFISGALVTALIAKGVQN